MNPSMRPDNNYRSFAGEDKVPDNLDLSAASKNQTISTFLKLSDGIHDQDIKVGWVPGGLETAVDLDWATNVSVTGGSFGTWGKATDNILRAKGPFKNIRFSGTLNSYGQRNGIDIELGNHFDQHPGLGSGCDLTGIAPHPNGDKVTFAVGWVIPFTVKHSYSNHKYLIWESFKLKAYVAFKHLVRLIIRIPHGTKGPSWL